MKVYYFTVIACGLMFLLNLAGIDTNSSQIINFISGSNIDGWRTSLMWIAVGVAVGGFILTTRISIGGFSYSPSVESVVAIFIGAIYLIFASDMYSIVSKVSTLTGGTGWAYWAVWALIIPMMAGYSISIVSYIRGTEG